MLNDAVAVALELFGKGYGHALAGGMVSANEGVERATIEVGLVTSRTALTAQSRRFDCGVVVGVYDYASKRRLLPREVFVHSHGDVLCCGKRIGSGGAQ
jgi:hypothetical protein